MRSFALHVILAPVIQLMRPLLSLGLKLLIGIFFIIFSKYFILYFTIRKVQRWRIFHPRPHIFQLDLLFYEHNLILKNKKLKIPTNKIMMTI